ncbi:hypothetical protein COCMIDRAFT_35641 [Bipolaris oryzae ATCC 44560]|uniref:RING-type domain-containing protein n=1 Tax=Bipolaris oryzae ATCC 44560 TaxID=930090 RepID=W6Z9W2_COCMI|nr:uncharacterized protein COCMIDRAFT_35641 [Bipolaris oryzae ATCC 44560]EUC46775.1 hypothetical protein COCMIDRAFT_35641 [Bipolaris oryzae ATCC 44560]
MPPSNPPRADTNSDSGAETTSSSDYDYAAPSTGYGFAYDSEIEARHAARRAERENTVGSTVYLSEREGEASGDTCSGFSSSNSGEDDSNDADGGSNAGDEVQEQQVGEQWDEQYDPDLEEGAILSPPPADRSRNRDGAFEGRGYAGERSEGEDVSADASAQEDGVGEQAPQMRRRFYGRQRAGIAYRGGSGDADAGAGAQEDTDEDMEEGEDAIGGHHHHVPHIHRRIYGQPRGGDTYGRDYSDDDASAGAEDHADDEMSPEPDARRDNAQRIIPEAFLYREPVVSMMVANLFMQQCTQPLSAVVSGSEPPNTECPICLEPPSETHECVQIRGVPGCTHLIGRVCLRQWFVNRPDGEKNCPLCRTQWLSQQGIWEIEDELIAELVPGPWRE